MSNMSEAIRDGWEIVDPYTDRLERENAQMRAVIAEQKETNARNFAAVKEQSALIETLAEALIGIRNEDANGTINYQCDKALAAYETWRTK